MRFPGLRRPLGGLARVFGSQVPGALRAGFLRLLCRCAPSWRAVMAEALALGLFMLCMVLVVGVPLGFAVHAVVWIMSLSVVFCVLLYCM